MRLISADTAIAELEELFIGLMDIFPADPGYIMPLREDVDRVMRVTQFERYQYLKPGMDCNAYVLLLMAYLKQEAWLDHMTENTPDGQGYAPAAAMADMDLFDGRMVSHRTGLIRTADAGWLIVEPQTDEVRRVKRGKDIAYRVYFP